MSGEAVCGVVTQRLYCCVIGQQCEVGVAGSQACKHALMGRFRTCVLLLFISFFHVYTQFKCKGEKENKLQGFNNKHC